MLVHEAIINREHSTDAPERRASENLLSIDRLLERRRKPLSHGWLLDFGTPPEIDIYNSSAPIWDGEKWVLAVREEDGDQFSSEIPFFSTTNFLGGKFRRESGISNLAELSRGYICQDPSLARIYGNWVITQVEVDPIALNAVDASVSSAVYAGEELDNLKLIARTPSKIDGMKGVRPTELLDGRLGIFTRPRALGDPERGGLGKEAFTIVESFGQITDSVLETAPLISELDAQDDTEWSGVNQSRLLPNGDIAVLDHLGRFEPSEIEYNKGYYSGFYTFDPETRHVRHRQILARVSDFKLENYIRPKHPSLKNVQYSSALEFPNNDIASPYAILIVGMGDSKMAAIFIPNPLDGWLADHPEYASQAFDQIPRQTVVVDSLAA